MARKTKSRKREPQRRKPAASRKSEAITLRLTPAEAAEIRRAAEEDELTITDYLVSRALHFRRLGQMLDD